METVIRDMEMGEIMIQPETEEEEIIQTLKTIVSTEKGTAPGCREIGTDPEPLHRRESVAKAILTRNIFVAVQDQEARATLKTVDFLEENPGKLTAVLGVDIHGG